MNESTSAPGANTPLWDSVQAIAFHRHHIATYLRDILLDEPVHGHFATVQTSFDGGSISRYTVVLVVTPTRLLYLYASDQPFPDSDTPVHVQVQAIPLRQLPTVNVVYGHTSTDDEPEELMLSIGWGTFHRVAIDAGHCGDPQCEANHVQGGLCNEDIQLRVSVQADGREKMNEVQQFVQVLRRANAAALIP